MCQDAFRNLVGAVFQLALRCRLHPLVLRPIRYLDPTPSMATSRYNLIFTPYFV